LKRKRRKHFGSKEEKIEAFQNVSDTKSYVVMGSKLFRSKTKNKQNIPNFSGMKRNKKLQEDNLQIKEKTK